MFFGGNTIPGFTGSFQILNPAHALSFFGSSLEKMWRFLVATVLRDFMGGKSNQK